MTHPVFIDIPNRAARVSSTLTQAPSPRLVHRCDEVLSFAMMEASGTVAPVTDWTEGRAIVRLTPGGDILLLDAMLTDNGESGTARRYTANWTSATMTSPALNQLLQDRTTDLACTCEIMWIAGGVTNRVTFEIAIAPAFNDPGEDDPPDPTEAASEAWLTARAVRFDVAQTLTSEQRVQALANLGITIGEDGKLTFHTGHSIYLDAPP